MEAIHRPLTGPDSGELLATANTRISTQELEAPSGFSIVVDDVDAGEEPEPEPEVNTTETLPASTTDNSTGANKEESDARIKQIQVEAESRKNEFAKLLEEHAQVIKELKQMEDDPPSGAVAGPTEA
ncbi:uncharacterized protein LOC111868381 [Cryptotermes secundus]|uniref:uncharacterized protein LOC111868381 n=1 Tax=Cryptotermes secundus TaxID=105785 RepID=UPI001454B900|nr:uncharacterized protein LOC111868381 [Cryptotermes secundus]